jgi:hypothetical protein
LFSYAKRAEEGIDSLLLVVNIGIGPVGIGAACNVATGRFQGWRDGVDVRAHEGNEICLGVDGVDMDLGASEYQ